MATSRQTIDIEAMSGLLGYLELIDAGNPPFGPLVVLTPQGQNLPRRGKAAGDGGEKARVDVRARDAPTRELGQEHAGVETEENAGANDAASWPDGPVVNNRAFGAHNTAHLVAALIPAAESNAGRLSIALLRETMKRIDFDGATTGRYALPLFVWFIKAGVLADTGEPWENRPYELMLTDHTEIREVLRATAPPEPEEIARAKEAGLK